MSTSIHLVSSFSEPNVNYVYVCLVGNITPAVGCEAGQSRLSCQVNDDEEVGTSKEDDALIEVQRSAAYHELISKSSRKMENLEKCPENIEDVDSNIKLVPLHVSENRNDEKYDENDNVHVHPKILSLTGTKWLTESRDGSPDARKPLLTPSASETSSVCEDLVPLPSRYSSLRVLSTVLALDKEHNLFGLSHTYIHTGPKFLWKMNKDDSKAIFHQTAIVQSCFKTCCRRRSRTDLPASLKCGSCKTCSCAKCRSSSCTSICLPSCGPCPSTCPPAVPCNQPCGAPCVVPCPLFWTKPCPPKPCPAPSPCPPSPDCCSKDCPKVGLELTIIKRCKYDPVYKEIEPKASCILQKPFAARSCHHVPHCIPPSSCFPYLMPCFWPARSGAPCSEPGRCFHNPPCPRGRTPKSHYHPQELCPHGKICAGKDNKEKCENYSCIGRNNEALAKALAEYK